MALKTIPRDSVVFLSVSVILLSQIVSSTVEDEDYKLSIDNAAQKFNNTAYRISLDQFNRNEEQFLPDEGRIRELDGVRAAQEREEGRKYSNRPDIRVRRYGRSRRQIATCPIEEARVPSGSAIKVGLVFYSPDSRRDVRIEHTIDGWTDDGLARLIEAGLDLGKPTLLYTHAYTQSANARWLMEIRRRYDELLSSSSKGKEVGFNLLVFDWLNYSSRQYSVSSSWVPVLGQVLGRFLELLGSPRYGYNLSQIHLVGYSLSTHIAGQAGRYLQSQVGAKIGQITALDPTGVCFHQDSNFAKKYNLQPSDASLVVAKHYDMQGLGSRRPIGGLDIFVNGGKNQPNNANNLFARGESIVQQVRQLTGLGLSHNRASEHESDILNEQCHEMAYACRNYEAFLGGECANCGKNGNGCYYMNTMDRLQNPFKATSSYKTKTKMFIKTASGSPFCLHHYQLMLRLQANASAESQDLLSNGFVSLRFNSNKSQAKVMHKVSKNKFTALLLTSDRLDSTFADLKMNIDAPTKKAQEFLSSVQDVQVNYMSHPDAQVRARESGSFCLTSSKRFVRC